MTLDGQPLGQGQRRAPPGAGGISIAGMLNELGLDPLRSRSSAISRSSRAATLDEVRVEDGDDYEIVHFVGGG